MASVDAGSNDVGDLLCIILDLNPFSWALSAEPDAETGDSLSLADAMHHLLVLANAHLALRHENQLAVFGTTYKTSRQLFSSQLSSTHSETENTRDSNTYQQFRIVDEKIQQGVKSMMEAVPDDAPKTSQINLVSALSMALCYVNRLNSATNTNLTSSNLSKPKPRVLIISVTEDASSQYVSMMNCIFTAQKNNIPIDVCKVYGQDAVFLQQACHLTSGSYLKLATRKGFLQYLLMAFLPGSNARKHLVQASQDQVDLRAACFCHRKIVDVGYVCSVCLSIFCSPLPVCSTCRTKFPMATLKRLGFGAKPANGNSATQPRSKKRKAPAATTGSTASTAS